MATAPGSTAFASTANGACALSGRHKAPRMLRSLTTTDLRKGANAMAQRLPLPTPGEVLAAEFLQPLGITPYRLAKDIHVPQTRIAAIIKGGRTITADTALRLARYFGTSAAFWLNLQQQYDADTTARAIEDELASIEPLALAG